MRLDLSTWKEIDEYLLKSQAVILPVGSTEQHGPLGIIGTDTLCAEAVARRAGELGGALVLPALAYTPAPFNMGFAGTISVSETVFSALVTEILAALAHHGFRQVYVLNGHGANLEPLRRVASAQNALDIHIRSWWEFPAVRVLRDELYGSWEGMHATPSEVAITQHTHRIVDHAPIPAPEPLTPEFIASHAGDRHGPPDEHRRQFPDGRVGSHSGLARPEHGETLLKLASEACAAEFNTLWARVETSP
ncbi:amidase [Kaistia sp. 32K]|uniref:creatininase family protein n=1 Tax=Kaistia sp. 32K TaxID=2795690 RepID=UPI001916051F|nr:creatininase family protein [Kaistia sp. 32K]BCP55206.1 amidase [Kaistia sp. 32K]